MKDDEGNSIEIVGSWLEVDKQYKAERQLKKLLKSKTDLEHAAQQVEEKLKVSEGKLNEENRKRLELETKLQQSEKQLEKYVQENEVLARQKNTNDQVKELENQVKSLEKSFNDQKELLKEAETQRDEAVQQLGELEKINQNNVTLPGQNELTDRQVSSSQDKWEYLSCISHELRIAFNAILGFSQILSLDNRLNEQQKDYLNEISSAGNHILSLVNELADLSNLESGKKQLHVENVCVVELIDECVELLKDMAGSKSLTINCVNNEESISLFAYIDRTRFKQALLNVLLTTIRQTSESGKIELFLDKNPENVILKVTHSSTEIPESLDASDIQLDKPVEGASVSSHTGLELLITRSLLQLMDGSIRYDFDPDKMVKIQIPLQKAETPAASPIEPVDSQNSQQISETYSVLYVEQDATNLKLVESILAQRPYYRFLPCQVPGKCLEVARKNNPAVILIDITGYGVDGYSFLNQLKSDKNLEKIPVIALGTDPSVEQVEKAKQNGFLDYLAKPVQITALLESIEGCLQSSDPGEDVPLKAQSQ